jgi:hypothetical protein
MGTPALRRGAWVLGGLAVLLLLGGCSLLFPQEETPLELDFAQILPAGWKAVDTWREVNIDGDRADEYLLLFRYDNGQVGAVIYDSQTGSVAAGTAPNATLGTVAVPLPSFGYFRPYPLLPSSWDYTYGGETGQGFVARPEDAEAIQVYTAARGPATGALAAAPPTELLLRGGHTHLTFVWWKNAVEGYGVTQLVAPGGFGGVDWARYAQAPKPLVDLVGLYPFQDYRARSLLCRETAYHRLAVPPAGEAAPVIDFAPSDEGINFCYLPIPDHPFYPEGVVLRYLLGNHERVGDHLVTPGAALAQVDADAGYSRVAQERVEDIATYPTVPVQAASLQGDATAPTTAVCVELAERAAPEQRRWVVFTLRYQPPDLERRLSDRWTLSGAASVPPPPVAPDDPYCASVLQRRKP